MWLLLLLLLIIPHRSWILILQCIFLRLHPIGRLPCTRPLKHLSSWVDQLILFNSSSSTHIHFIHYLSLSCFIFCIFISLFHPVLYHIFYRKIKTCFYWHSLCGHVGQCSKVIGGTMLRGRTRGFSKTNSFKRRLQTELNKIDRVLLKSPPLSLYFAPSLIEPFEGCSLTQGHSLLALLIISPHWLIFCFCILPH